MGKQYDSVDFEIARRLTFVRGNTHSNSSIWVSRSDDNRPVIVNGDEDDDGVLFSFLR